jgi:hypothetical protein
MIESSCIDQYNRVIRFLGRLEYDNYGSTNYDDNLYSFFQNCWHLKDWIKNDSKIDKTLTSSIEKVVKNYPNIMISCDIANASKHLKLSTSRVGAEVVSRSVTVNLGDVSKSKCSHKIVLDDGTEVVAQEVAKLAVEEWKLILVKNGLL